jgi:hypothetical protein
MWRRQARVVRKAPSRWTAMIFFQSLKASSWTPPMIWLPALLQRISTPPYSRMVLGDGFLHGVFIGHVHRQAEHLAARGGGDLGRCGFRPRLLQIGNHYPGALRRQSAGPCRDRCPKPLR